MIEFAESIRLISGILFILIISIILVWIMLTQIKIAINEEEFHWYFLIPLGPLFWALFFMLYSLKFIVFKVTAFFLLLLFVPILLVLALFSELLVINRSKIISNKKEESNLSEVRK